jgi:hypothetical protein
MQAMGLADPPTSSEKSFQQNSFKEKAMKTTINLYKNKSFIFLLALVLALAPAFSLSRPVQAEPIPCVVTSDADSGDGTLRAWLADTNCSTITFSDSHTIHLTGPLAIETGRTITIDGTGHTVNITDDNYRRVIAVKTGADTTLQNLTITQSSIVFYWQDSDGGVGDESMIPNFGTLKVNDSTLVGNSTSGPSAFGGGIYNQGTLTITRSTFTGNSALAGGAIYNDGYRNASANVTVKDSTFSGNTSTVTGPSQYWTGILGGGAAIVNFLGTLTVTGSTFSGNTANYLGGAIVTVSPIPATVTNSTFNNNSSSSIAGAIYALGGMLNNNTFVGNSAPDSGAIWFYDAAEAPMVLYNNLMVKGDTGANCSIQTPQPESGMTPNGTTGTHNLADDDSCVTTSFTGVTTVSNLSTQVGMLGDNGGPTQTIPLLAGSPAIDAGDDTNCPVTDQRDVSRIQGAHCDVGAFEYEYVPMTFSPATLPDVSLGTDYYQTIMVSGGFPPYSFVIGGDQLLLAGLTLDTSSGNILISGTPTEAGQANLDVYVIDQTGEQIEIQPAFWIKTDPSLTLTSSLNPSLDGQEVTFSLGSIATVLHSPAPWGQVAFYADGAVISGCDGLWLGNDPTTKQPAPNPVTCKTSALAVGSHAITAALTTVYGPYNSATATLPGGQTVNANVPQYISAGLDAPLDLGNVLNAAKAGQMIPLKWRLLDSAGNPVTNLDPASVTMTISSYACPSSAAVDAIETYASGTSVLQNLGDGYYQMNWKTLSSYSSSCKKLTLKIGSWSDDGFSALFWFKK